MKYQFNLFKSPNNCCKNRGQPEKKWYRINNFTSLLSQFMYACATKSVLEWKDQCLFLNNVWNRSIEGDSEAQGRNCIINRWSYSSIPSVGERDGSLSLTLLPIATEVSLQRLEIPSTPSHRERQLSFIRIFMSPSHPASRFKAVLLLNRQKAKLIIFNYFSTKLLPFNNQLLETMKVLWCQQAVKILQIFQ